MTSWPVHLKRCIPLVALTVAVEGFSVQRYEYDFELDALRRDMLWQGMDASIGAIAGSGTLKHPDTVQNTRFLLLGAFDSGTHLLQELVNRNYFWGQPHLFNGIPTCPSTTLWKHSNGGIQDFYAALDRLHAIDNLRVEDTVVLVTLRSPISQVRSWRKAPYDLKYCMERPWTEMSSPCNATTFARLSTNCWQSDREEVEPSLAQQSIRFNSTMSVYNEYVRLYLGLQQDQRFKAFKIVTYEEMLYDPRKVVRDLAPVLGTNLKLLDIDIPAESLKGKDTGAHGRQKALEIYHERQWLRDIGSDALRSLCGTLDKDLISNMTEGSGFHDGVMVSNPVPYTRDCAEGA